MQLTVADYVTSGLARPPSVLETKTCVGAPGSAAFPARPAALTLVLTSYTTGRARHPFARVNNMNKTIYEVFSDGSASTHGCKAGGWAAVILKDGRLKKIVYGATSDTTIGKMEMQALTEAFAFIRELPGAFDAHIKALSDSQYIVNCAVGRYKRSANKPEWRIFDAASKGLSVEIDWVGRNQIPEQAQCDELAGACRLKVENSKNHTPIRYKQ